MLPLCSTAEEMSFASVLTSEAASSAEAPYSMAVTMIMAATTERLQMVIILRNIFLVNAAVTCLIAYSADSLDELSAVSQLLSESPYMNVNSAALACEVIAPYLPEEAVPRKHLSPVPHEHQQQVVLLQGEVHLFAVGKYLVL